ncbi:DUF6332 family protein [Streptomyces sp. NBC_00178]|uniref:DUF6332 family protein n=1 Tax=Streptomyces sp. NBC_00178 TaxID=2975672 RepID=UPI002E295012|nr:DUF6332 family protein [Streptomyces sp. NBC_00178]
MGARTQEQKDEATVEALYVAISAAILAATVLALVASPALLLDMVRGDDRRVLIICGKWAAAATFLARLTYGYVKGR